MITIGIIVGSTRPGRNGAAVAQWVHQRAAARNDARFELLDLAEFDLPHLDEPMPAAFSTDYAQPHTRRWAEAVAACDGFILVTPEYNHGTTGVLKNALDFLFHEWNNKAVGFVSYGAQGGTRAVEHLRLVAAELKLADVRSQVALSLFNDFEQPRNFSPGEHHHPIFERMLDELISWADALRSLRQPAAA
jgi:NAD(P)H-dependent FMN reductase